MQIIENAVYMGAATPGQGGGSAPVINELNVTPSTSAQTITAPEGVDGYSPVNVSAVDSTIDANIVAGNIKKDVQILGVTGSYEGQTPTGTMYIISNGTYNVADKAIANVQVPTTVPAHYIEKTVDANGKLINSTNIINLNGVTDIDEYVLYSQYKKVSFPVGTTVDFSSLTAISGSYACNNMFAGCTGLTSVDLSGLTTISGSYGCQNMFDGCSSLTNINLSGLTTISSSACQNMFVGCIGLTSVDLSGLTTISSSACENMFRNCTGLTSVDLSGLITVSGNYCFKYMFDNCSNLTNINLSGLTTISGSSACESMFDDCIGLTSVDLSGLTTISGNSPCTSMFAGCTGLTSVDLSGLTTISGSQGCVRMFSGCTGLTSVDLSGLTTISGSYGCQNMFRNCTGLTSFKANRLNVLSAQLAYSGMFDGCTGLESVSFGGLTASTFSSIVNQFQYLFNNTTGSSAINGCTVHFPSNFDPSDPNHTFDASTLTGYPTFGGSASYIHVAFDLPATE